MNMTAATKQLSTRPFIAISAGQSRTRAKPTRPRFPGEACSPLRYGCSRGRQEGAAPGRAGPGRAEPSRPAPPFYRAAQRGAHGPAAASPLPRRRQTRPREAGYGQRHRRRASRGENPSPERKKNLLSVGGILRSGRHPPPCRRRKLQYPGSPATWRVGPGAGAGAGKRGGREGGRKGRKERKGGRVINVSAWRPANSFLHASSSGLEISSAGGGCWLGSVLSRAGRVLEPAENPYLYVGYCFYFI